MHTGAVAERYPEGWAPVEGALERTFAFPSFAAAVAFVNRVAERAEAADHHPDIAIRYRKVTLRYWTHTASAITERDVSEAEHVGSMAG